MAPPRSGLRPPLEWRHLGLAVFAGLAQAVSIAAPWNGQPLWWLQILSLAMLAGLLQRQPSWRRAGLVGWTFAIAWLAGTWWWLFISMHVYGGLAAPLAVVAVLGLAAFLGSYYAAAGAAFWALARGGTGAGAIVFGALWLLAELMRGTWFTGFPWGAGGYAHVDGPLAALAPWVGAYGIAFVAAALAAALAGLTLRPGRVAAAALGAGALALVGAAHLRPPAEGTAAGAPLSVALLQGNIPQDEKFQGGTGIPVALDWYGAQLRDSRASLVVAPETAIPLLPEQLPEGYLGALAKDVVDDGRAALIGIPLGNFQQGYTNSVIGLKPQAPVYRFDKHHLVPFGEFIPPLFRWFTDLMNIPLGDFNRGAVGQPSFAWQGQRLAPNICYEDLFGEELGARFADPATAPTIFVNVSNIAWFGNTVAIDQHLQISRMRALEFRRPVVRATNTGATAVIDHRGVVTHRLQRHTRGVLGAQVEGRQGLTPFARWIAAAGLWPYWMLGVAIVLIASGARRLRAAPREMPLQPRRTQGRAP
ncbi:apolipoprotein N-acyltransferase [Ramlibacter tataouinensis]|uniref:Apolipoprotein N-acyltransferase n=1 Tax=Ramlibacter tataouinensis (strain ATCC BAA-407 / DSM 14655 / LMG 21543 / TTB310) TaxID=365046 RepID=F5XW61_RAMTT|nr:apolipoprotein N-acyltransferase [Ramlibacter tataouinensis]AEG91631.1 Candidate apolipoprotein N-acyltransferase (ALP N-acyltransferase), membrane protein [Ramlibacter tataouinensis TTB310]